MEKRKTISDVVLELTLQGKHEQAQRVAEQVIAFYREEDAKLQKSEEEGKCYDCGHVFTETDVQYGEFEPFTLCEICYVRRGGK